MYVLAVQISLEPDSRNLYLDVTPTPITDIQVQVLTRL